MEVETNRGKIYRYCFHHQGSVEFDSPAKDSGGSNLIHDRVERPREIPQAMKAAAKDNEMSLPYFELYHEPARVMENPSTLRMKPSRHKVQNLTEGTSLSGRVTFCCANWDRLVKLP